MSEQEPIPPGMAITFVPFFDDIIGDISTWIVDEVSHEDRAGIQEHTIWGTDFLFRYPKGHRK